MVPTRYGIAVQPFFCASFGTWEMVSTGLVIRAYSFNDCFFQCVLVIEGLLSFFEYLVSGPQIGNEYQRRRSSSVRFQTNISHIVSLTSLVYGSHGRDVGGAFVMLHAIIFDKTLS